MKTLTALLSMAIFTVVVIVLVTATVANADVRVRGHYRSNGTYVQPHYRSNPDGNPYNNWSTYPNINPYTGKRGTKRFGTTDFSNIAFMKNKPNYLPVYPSNIPGSGSSWNKPSPLPYNPSDDLGRNFKLRNQ